MADTGAVLPLESASPAPSHRPCIALVGNPNTGKTTLFNRLTGLRARTANYPGITVDVKSGALNLSGVLTDVVDLPGLYSLHALSPEEQVTHAALTGNLSGHSVPDAVVLVLDATNLERNLFVASEVLDLKLPTIVALNQIDAAESEGITVDVDRLRRELNCPVVPLSARSGAGIDQLKQKLEELLVRRLPLLNLQHTSCTAGCSGCQFAARYDWAHRISGDAVTAPESHGWRTAAIDSVLTRPVIGVLVFLGLMLGIFYLIFSLAGIPMDLVDGFFGQLGEWVSDHLPSDSLNRPAWFGMASSLALAVLAMGYWGAEIRWTRTSAAAAAAVSIVAGLLPPDDFRSLLVDGVIGGIGGVLIFLPQICILFFLISLLEDSGYMARAAFVMERLMRFVGLPGKAFVPMLSAHACAIPGIMAARVIESWRDRLVTILVLPLLTCSARLPVYTMIASLLFAGSPLQAALVFVGAYLLGISAALGSAWLLKKTILRGDTVQLVIELPAYRLPSISNAVTMVVDRGLVFVRQAGSVILLISVILWGLATFPRLPEDAVSPSTQALQTQLAALEEAGETDNELQVKVDHLLAQESLSYSFAGRVGHLVEPIFRPLGFDWKINVGIITSFAAREVVVSTLAIVYGLGEEAADEDHQTLVETLRRQKRPDGSRVFNTATGLSLLVFFVLAMQCLPTQAVTRRETGSWKWAALQLIYMTGLAWLAAFATYQTLTAVAVV
ncbi:MAG: ferrous iron transporter B [Planctomycetaceae bacterium]